MHTHCINIINYAVCDYIVRKKITTNSIEAIELNMMLKMIQSLSFVAYSKVKQKMCASHRRQFQRAKRKIEMGGNGHHKIFD